jgi:hypothetical protein
MTTFSQSAVVANSELRARVGVIFQIQYNSLDRPSPIEARVAIDSGFKAACRKLTQLSDYKTQPQTL